MFCRSIPLNSLNVRCKIWWQSMKFGNVADSNQIFTIVQINTMRHLFTFAREVIQLIF